MFGLGAQAGHLFKPAFCCDGDSSGGHFPARPMTPPCFGLQDIRAVQPPQLHAPDVPDSLDALQPVNCGELEEDDEDGELSMTLGALKRCQEKKAEQVELKRFLSRHRRVAARNLFGVRFLALYPIHVAAKLGKPQMVKVLLRAGADKEKNTSQGRSALDLAQQAKDSESRIQVIHILQGTEMLIKQKWSAKDLLMMELNLTHGRCWKPQGAVALWPSKVLCLDCLRQFRMCIILTDNYLLHPVPSPVACVADPVDVHPQNMVERTFAILVLIFGLVLFSSFVSSITASMTQLRNMQEDKSKQFWLLRRYLLQKKVPQDLTFKVLRYTEYATSRSGEAIPEHRITILSLLTKQLQSELRFVTHFGCVKLHGFFKLVCTMNESLLHMMSTGKALVSKALASQDPLFELVDPALCMYFVDQGQVQYCQGQSALGLGGGLSTWAPSNFDSEGLLPPDPETVQPVTPTESGIAIGKGGHLCEIVLWAQWRHVGSARAIHESNIVQVIAKGFAECIRRDPAVDSVAAMYARMFVQLANDRERIPEDWQEICNDEMTALTDSLSEYSPDSETPKNLMSRIMALTKPKARSF
ncbi:unnamed protein product [Durusdinium trenchii]|uniref:Uncharacterized protein n=1 Tax=Durusdinium trenchii TaxID=1381693 RepID=A0ABP0IK30_9DINO